MIGRICFLTNGYPSEKRAVNTFVDQLVCQLADMGISCTVISPQSASKILLRQEEALPPYRERTTPSGNKIAVYTPKYLSASAYRKGLLNTSALTMASYYRAAARVFGALHRKQPFDAVYGHFIFPAGIAASRLGGKYRIPSFFAFGENTNYTIDCFGPARTAHMLRHISGVVSVSSQNERVLTRQAIVPAEKIEVFPNGVDDRCFFPRNREQMRERYSLPKDAFIVAFVGRFEQVKGAQRLSRAIEQIGSDKVKSIFIGQGEWGPTCGGILLQGPQPHRKVPELLSAADIFVLPTLAEGCCNAIVEAMACGLPVVSSALPFNDDILDDTCSIRIDPNSVEQLAEAIRALYVNVPYRRQLSAGALKRAAQLTIKERAGHILSFLETCAEANRCI